MAFGVGEAPTKAQPFGVEGGTATPLPKPPPKSMSLPNIGVLAQKAGSASLGALEKVGETSAQLAQFPLNAADALLGAPNRAVLGAASAQFDKSKNPLEGLNRATYAVFHPNDQATQDKYLTSVESLGGMVPTAPKGLGKAAEDFAVQTATDPLTYVPGLDLLSVGKRLAGAGKLARLGESAARSNVGRFFSSPDVQRSMRNILQSNAFQKATAHLAPKTSAAQIGSMDELAAIYRGITDTAQDFMKGVDREVQRGTISEKEGALLKKAKLRAPKVTAKDRTSGLTPLREAYREALFSVRYPHELNIGRLAYLAPESKGVTTVARGLQYARKGAPKDIEQLFSAVSKSPEYLAGEVGTPIEQGLQRLGPVGQKAAQVVSNARARGQQKLSAFDKSMRQALMVDIMKNAKFKPKITLGKEGPELTGQSMRQLYQIADEVNKSIGRYATSPAIQLAEKMGGYFPAWRLGVVPYTMARAATKAPAKFERLTRAEKDLYNQTGIRFGGPESDAAELANLPYGSLSYLASPSTIGPVGTARYFLGSGSPKSKGKAFARETASQLLNVTPGGNLVTSIPQLSPYKENPNALFNLMLHLVGGWQDPQFQKKVYNR